MKQQEEVCKSHAKSSLSHKNTLPVLPFSEKTHSSMTRWRSCWPEEEESSPRFRLTVWRSKPRNWKNKSLFFIQPINSKIADNKVKVKRWLSIQTFPVYSFYFCMFSKATFSFSVFFQLLLALSYRFETNFFYQLGHFFNTNKVLLKFWSD